jgi:hypothetical protein
MASGDSSGRVSVAFTRSLGERLRTDSTPAQTKSDSFSPQLEGESSQSLAVDIIVSIYLLIVKSYSRESTLLCSRSTSLDTIQLHTLPCAPRNSTDRNTKRARSMAAADD